MLNHFYKINKAYLNNFSSRVFSIFNKENIKSNSIYLRSILKEINNLFEFIGGMVSTKDNIPRADEYPDAEKFNILVSDIGTDIQKLYTTQNLLDDDVNNLLNFNSSQRTKIFKDLSVIQQLIYSIYIKNKTTITGEVTIPSNNPFKSSNNLDALSTGVTIDETRGLLTLQSTSAVTKPIDTKNVQVFFINKIPIEYNLYPNNINLHLGSHWKIPSIPISHFVDTNNPTNKSNYCSMMIDDSSSNTGIGWCEFEAIYGSMFAGKQDLLLYNLKKEIGTLYNKDPQFIYLDAMNSIQSQYITTLPLENISNGLKYKITIPFLNADATNEIDIQFQADKIYNYPNIDWTQSKIYSMDNKVYNFIEQSLSTDNGIYKFMVRGGFIRPSRMEIIVYYGADILHWIDMGFTMSHYVYNIQQQYALDQSTGSIAILLSNTFDIFVDTEPNNEAEVTRALNVLKSLG